MTWEQKLAALNALSADRCMMTMLQPGVWSLRVPRAELKQGGILGSLSATGASPEAVVEAVWRRATVPPKGAYVVLNAMGENKRRAVAWNGYMWADLNEAALA